MADIQSQFESFHDEIRLSDDDGKAKLREKREILIGDLRKGLKKRAEDGMSAHSFEHFNQGGNAMHVGNKPLVGEYDIDVGIVFNNTADDFDNPVELKKIVRDALDSNVRTVKIRRPCVTVTYIKDGEPEFHVDLAVYVKTDDEELLELTMGREHSSEDNMEWFLTDPKGLIKKINSRFSDDAERSQFKRCVRYIKRWRDRKFSKDNEAPISIALTCAAYEWFEPVINAGQPSDLQAMLDLVNEVLNNFSLFFDRLSVCLPVTPENDLFEKMTDVQMGSFKEKLKDFRDVLQASLDEDSVVEACKGLTKQFGDEFPVPESQEDEALSSKTVPYVVTGNSA